MKAILLMGVLITSFSAEAAILSSATNEVYLAVVESRPGLSGPGTNEPFQFDSKLAWAAYCNTGKVSLWYALDPSYGVKIKMLDPNGKEVTKTSSGANFGSKWNVLRSYKETKLQPIYAWGSFESNQGQSSGGVLPAPRELFKMKESGTYTLQIEMQMFRYVATKDTNEWSRNLLYFPPFRITIVKP
jgi:hypothetical protein